VVQEIDLSGRTAVVTGGGSGMGAAICRLFAARGAKVAVLGIHEAGVEETASQLSDGFGLMMDVADPASVTMAFKSAVGRLGGLDIVVHAAGVDDVDAKRLVREQSSQGLPIDVVSRMTDDQWRRVIAVNLDGSFFVLRSALQHMIPQHSGAIVLIGSESGVRGIAGFANYGASKGGVHALVRSAAKEAIAHGVRVNGIAPGVIDTPMSQRTEGAYSGPDVAPIGRVGTPGEIAKVALFLVTDLASYVVGEVINVDGGRMAC